MASRGPGWNNATTATPSPVKHVSLDQAHTCAALESGAVKCWGDAEYGAIGSGDNDDLGNQPGEMPPPDVNLGGSVVALAVGQLFNCALMQNNAVRCWGYNTHGSLGYGHTNHIGDEPGEMPPPFLF